MSRSDVTAARPAAAPPPPPAARPRPPFRPLSFLLASGGAAALLTAQFYFERAWLPALEAAGSWSAPLFTFGEWLVTPLLLLHVVADVVLYAGAIACFVWTLRQIKPKYHAPLLITLILVGAYFYYGALENLSAPWLAALTGGWLTSYAPTFVTIAAAVAVEFILGRIAYGKWIDPTSAYISGISAGILIKSPELWPFVLCAAISITSKYALRLGGRHLWNPTNFGVTVMVLLAAQHTGPLSVQYGNVIWVNILIWTLGALILWKFDKLHIPVTFAVVYLLLTPLKSWATGNEWVVEAAPLTGPMYQLFMCFMITDPKTITQSKWSQCLVAGLVAVAEMLFRLAPTWFTVAPAFLALVSADAAFIALFVVGPAANVIEILRKPRKSTAATQPPVAAAAPAKADGVVSPLDPGRAAGFLPAVGSNPPG